ncbi:hypothetical protein [Hydrogenobaculum acidophilum]
MKEEFIEGIKKFEEREKRDIMYKVATFLVSQYWSIPSYIADGVCVLLLTWNQAFYKYGYFDFKELEKCIEKNLQRLGEFRQRDITSLSQSDEEKIKLVFDEFLKALEIADGNKRSSKSPVAVAKALHLLAPNFFPLWDNKIARAYGCYYNNNPAEKYVQFMKLMKELAMHVKSYVQISNYQNKTLLKLIDEYNYSKYTKGWI